MIGYCRLAFLLTNFERLDSHGNATHELHHDKLQDKLVIYSSF